MDSTSSPTNPSGQGTPPLPAAAKSTPLPKNVTQNTTDVNPEIAERTQEQSEAIPTSVPPPSAPPPKDPLPHQVASSSGEAASSTVSIIGNRRFRRLSDEALHPPGAEQSAPPAAAQPNPKLAAFRHISSQTSRVTKMADDRSIGNYEKLKADLEELERRYKETPKPGEPSDSAAKTVIKKEIDTKKRELDKAAEDIFSKPETYKALFEKDRALALHVLKHVPPPGTPIVSCLNRLISERHPMAMSLLDDLSHLENVYSQQIIEDLVPELCKSSQSIESATEFICLLLKTDVQRAENEGTLLRTNTMCTNLYTAYQIARLKPLMQRTIGPVIQKILQVDKNFVVQNKDPKVGIDPKLTNQIGDLPVICSFSDQFLELLLGELSKKPSPIPEDIQIIYQTLSASIKARGWDQNIDTHLNSFVFLRCLCPAFVSPQKLALDIKIPPEKLRNLSAVSIAINDVVNNATEIKGKWDQELYISKKGETTYVARKQPLLKEIAKALLQKP